MTLRPDLSSKKERTTTKRSVLYYVLFVKYRYSESEATKNKKTKIQSGVAVILCKDVYVCVYKRM